jgi:dienelactone hydrolase
MEGDLATQMVDGLHRFLDGQTAGALEARNERWQRDFNSPEKYSASVAPQRAELARIIGAIDPRTEPVLLELVATTRQPALVGRGAKFEIFAVRWPAWNGVTGEGLLLVPTGRAPLADCVAIPDADQTPEQLAGLMPGIAPDSQFARRLAESGCRVLIPTLIDRSDLHSVVGDNRFTNQPHREFIYRQAFEMGRHIIGYEVQKIRAAIDFFAADTTDGNRPFGLFGYGEGGLLALHAAALDERVDVTAVSGYFDSRQNLWQEPIYHNVFGLLRTFGDAELASLIAPRTLIVEACTAPIVTGPPAPRDGRSGAAPGQIRTPKLDAVRQELDRAQTLVAGLEPQTRFELVVSGDGNGSFGTEAWLIAAIKALSPIGQLAPSAEVRSELREDFSPAPRLLRQFEQLVEFNQRLLREAEYTRKNFWLDASAASLDSWKSSTEKYREIFYRDVIGRFDLDRLPPNVRTRQVYDEPKYVGYEVVLDVFPDVYAYGLLLVPRGIQPGERRPCVVCQHGLEGRPQAVADPTVNDQHYNQYGCRLAERGYVVFAPQNPYIGQDRFRSLQRKANPLATSLFSIIVPQHQTIVDWLKGQEFVDPQRIAFYGLSYGGKTAMRVPAIVTDYCLSICSADFNEWIWKNTSARSPYSYIATGEYEMFEFNLGNTFNYAEMAWLISPRPFMVERGHHDGVAPDEWVAYEFAKVRRKYVELKIPDRTEIEFFDGPHTIHGVGTFQFLDRHLQWTPPTSQPAR